MRVVVLRVTATAEPEKREVVGIDLEAVFVTEDLKERCELRVRYLGGASASFTHKVFVVVVQRDMPSSRLAVSQRNVMHQTDAGQIIENPVDGRRLYPAGVLQYMVDDHPGAEKRLINLGQGAHHGRPGKGQAQSGCPDSLDHQIFGDNHAVSHELDIIARASDHLLQVDVIRIDSHLTTEQVHLLPPPGVSLVGFKNMSTWGAVRVVTGGELFTGPPPRALST